MPDAHLSGAGGTISVLAYRDEAVGELAMYEGHLHITKVVLHPAITIAADADLEQAMQLIERARIDCFIGNSITSTLIIAPQVIAAQEKHPQTA